MITPGDYRNSRLRGLPVVYAKHRDVRWLGSLRRYGNRPRHQLRASDPDIRQRRDRASAAASDDDGDPDQPVHDLHMHQPTVHEHHARLHDWWTTRPPPGDVAQKQKYPTDTRCARRSAHPRGGGGARQWADPEFSAEVSELNPKLKG